MKEKLKFNEWFFDWERLGLLTMFYGFIQLVTFLPLEFVGEFYWYPLLLVFLWSIFILIFGLIRKHWNSLYDSGRYITDRGLITKSWTYARIGVLFAINLIEIAVMLYWAFG